jgi:hypothetical protein
MIELFSIRRNVIWNKFLFKTQFEQATFLFENAFEGSTNYFQRTVIRKIYLVPFLMALIVFSK